MLNWPATVISQYNQSPTIQTLLDAVNQWLDPTKNINDFYNFIWNVSTAKDYGLDVWGRIVGVDRTLYIETTDLYWGFSEATTLSAKPFDTHLAVPGSPQGGGIFYSGEPLTSNYLLPDDGFRTLIMAKAAFNICNGSIPAINQILVTLFPKRGNAYVIDNHNMSMTYTFEFNPTPVETGIIQQSGVLPTPTGVLILYNFGVSPKTNRVQATAKISGTGGSRAASSLYQFQAQLQGAGNLYASAIVLAAPRASIGGVGTMLVDAAIKGAQLYPVSATIGATGSLLVTALSSTRYQAATQISATGTVHVDATVKGAPLQDGALLPAVGTLHADGKVTQRFTAGAIIGGQGAFYASGMRVISGVVRIGGVAGLRAIGTEADPAASEIDGVGQLNADAHRVVFGAARIAGVAGIRAISGGSGLGATRIAGVGTLRANGTLLSTAKWDSGVKWDSGAKWG